MKINKAYLYKSFVQYNSNYILHYPAAVIARGSRTKLGPTRIHPSALQLVAEGGFSYSLDINNEEQSIHKKINNNIISNT